MLENFFMLLESLMFSTAMVESSFPEPLKEKEEQELLNRWWQGDITARDELIRHNMRLVVHVAKKYGNYPDGDELISVGSIGLIKAVNTYSSGKGTQLATYAARCIENEILMLMRANKKHRNNRSLFDPVSVDKEGNDITLIDLIATDGDSVIDTVQSDILKETLKEVMGKALSAREREILDYRYGLENKPELTQIEIAKIFNISRSYVSRIEKRALEKLREYLDGHPNGLS